MKFNNEKLKGYYLIIDARTDEEKSLHLKKGTIDGTVIVFFNGHAQRSDNAFTFTSRLALKSKSGIVIVPICDTPFGKNSEFRGDKGKIIILMEMIRHALLYYNMDISNNCTEKSPVTINGNTIPVKEDTIKVNLSAVGWSHGALLARMFSSRYNCVKNLVQICPAGFLEWGDTTCTASCCLLSSFNWESIRISTEIFKGNGREVLSTGWGISKGIAGDTFRSCNSCINGNFNLLKIFRAYKDLIDASAYETGKTYPVKNLSSIVVIFGQDDSLFHPEDIVGNDYVNPENTDAFFRMYYPEAVGSSRLHLFVLPGKHIAPVLFYKEYVQHTLHYIGELKE